MVDTEKYDIVIVGGGISGLYTAWRLASSTNYSIAVLEYSHRFGGRYRTCHMPGGFPAELGAMRLIQKWHPILAKLIEDMKLEVEPFFTTMDTEYISAYYVKGRLIQNDESELSKIYKLSDGEKQHYLGVDASYNALELPENGNFFTAVLAGSKQLARNVTLKQWWGESLNAGVISQKGLSGFDTHSVVTEAAFMRPFSDPDCINQFMCIKGGMEKLVVEVVTKLKKLEVALLSGHRVTRVEELSGRFKVKAMVDDSPTWFSADKLILACNARGLELITWIGEADRTTEIHKLLHQVEKKQMKKLYLTYRNAWWETTGLKCGHIISDLPIAYVTLFGSRGTVNGYSTLMVYSFVDAEVFEGLNSEEEERFENTEGEIPSEQIPSKILVQNIQRQLGAVFGMSDIPEPVAACITTWSKDPIAYATYSPKLSINHNSLYWRTLRPFGDNSEVFMIGDTFTAVDRKCIYRAWSEGALLTAERVLHKYFKLEPYMDGLCLENPWPEDD